MAASASTAGAMWLVWNAPATDSGRNLAPAGGFAANSASCAIVPAATIWPAPFTLAGVSPQASIAASTASSSPPSTAVIPVSSAAAAAAMPCARTRTRRMASSGVITPASTPAASSPTLWPATATDWRLTGCLPVTTWSSAAAMAAATSSG